ncbi:hypothetical protein A3D77_01160 [Candidatus Gottesmanbacteria bacterium RIFCSPHIGHO2_02_FULL_39_11]|uniref:Type 4 fimbrial biogenesis protein PilX N-terminal domain-containing protein n=1 Tax=Candidatus Gottesmanbacteria bacterium RIFCSPHIGHO2_02_FULL_39_11 TaxID=1798382 RepID=A0A1F5ZJM6_9BACT|nr:MAG: hypothetical protein A3D77_01160 [Candidatus Gottesmanbacteria bacterium RIFCSPHIGHO2_02_FULL_39_11]
MKPLTISHQLSTNSGQALVTLLVFMIVAITIVTASVGVVMTNSLAAGSVAQTTSARSIAESGVENALIRLARNPSYTGETLPVGNGQASVTVTGTTIKTITSIGTDGNFKRTIVATASQSAYVWSVISWQENY